MEPTEPELPVCDCGTLPGEDGLTVHNDTRPLYEAPTQPEAHVCDCGVVPGEDGVTVHAETCPLYERPAISGCPTCGVADHEVADCPVEAVRVLLAAQPTPETIAALDREGEDGGLAM